MRNTTTQLNRQEKKTTATFFFTQGLRTKHDVQAHYVLGHKQQQTNAQATTILKKLARKNDTITASLKSKIILPAPFNWELLCNIKNTKPKSHIMV